MPDISDLIIQVRNTQNAVNEIKKVTDALKETQKTATTVGKGLFAAWSFTKVIQGARMLGDSFKESLITLRNFDVLYGKLNSQAERSVKRLQNAFGETEISAKALLNTIGSRTFEFGLDPDKFGEVNSQLAKASASLAAFFKIDTREAADKLTRSLYGMTRGLAQFGILVDQNSSSFKKQVEDLKNYQGYTEKAATALTILNEILKQTKKYEGANVEEAKTLSKAFDNISNTLKHGIFAEAGKILSEVFVPILNKVNDALSNPWVQKIGGIITALGGVLIAIKSITVAMGTLKTVLIAISALKIGVGGGIAAIGAKLAGITAGITAAIAGLPVALTAAIVGVLTLAGTMIINKVSTGEWLNFSKMIEIVGSKINQFFDSIINYVAGLGFSTDVNRRNALSNQISLIISSYQNTFKEVNEEFDKFIKSLDKTKIKELDEKSLDVILTLDKEYDKILKRYNEGQIQLTKSLAERDALVDKINKLQKDLEQPMNFYKRSSLQTELKAARERLDSVLADARLQVEQNKKDAATMTSIAQKAYNVSKEAYVKYQERLKEYIDNLTKTLDIKNWWEKINSEFTKLSGTSSFDKSKLLNSVKNRVENIKDYLDKVEEQINLELSKPKDEQDVKRIKDLENIRLSKQKELVDLVREEANIKLDSLKKEEDLLKETNDMILDYAKRALEFKETGSEVIKSGTMEEMRFITSSLGPVNQLQNAINTAQTASNQLDQKRNSILTDTKNILNRISQTLSKQSGVVLRAVDYSG